MPKIKITRLPKALNGGEQCPEGYVWDASKQACIGKDGCAYGYAKNSRGECVPSYVSGANTAPSTNDFPVVTSDTQQSISDGCAPGFKRNARGECVPSYTIGTDPSLANTQTGMGPFPDNIGGAGVTGPASVSTTTTAAPNNKFKKFGEAMSQFDRAFSNISQQIKNKKLEKDYRKQMFRQAFEQPVTQGYRGNVETNTGVQWPNLLTPPNEGMFISQYGGQYMGQDSNKALRIKILSGPQEMKYGGQSSSYGLDLGWKIGYTEMNKSSTDYYTNNISEEKNPKSPYVLEAEGGETILKPGDGTLHNIQGPSHAEGGVKLTDEDVNSRTQPDIPSFIYSQDKKRMTIKDPKVLNYFGFSKPATPAKISKKFQLNKDQVILQNKYSDAYQKNTAALNINKKLKFLSDLAKYQEVVMKGEPAPNFTMMQDEQNGQMPEAKYGGAFLPEYNTYVPEYQPGGSTPPKHGERRLNPNSPGDTQVYDGYNNTWIPDADWIAKYRTVTPATGPSGGSNTGFKNIAKGKGNLDWNTIHTGYNPGYWDSKENYNKNWIPKVEAAFADPTKAAMLISRLENYGGQDAKDVQAAIKRGKTLEEKIKIAKKLGTQIDYIGPYHAILAEAIDNLPPGTTTKPPGTTTKTTVPDVGGDLGTPPKKQDEPQKPGYICIPGVNGNQVIEVPVGGYETKEEATQNCGSLAPEIPYGYTAPDIANMYGTAAIRPRLILPFVPNPSFTPGQLPLQDWRARTASRFSTQYAAPAQTLAAYSDPQGLASNLSKLSGEAAQAMAAQDMAPIIGDNVRAARDFMGKETSREDAYKQLLAKNAMERWKGNAIALQQYDNARRKYIKDNVQAFADAWENRKNLGDINSTNTHFFTDPRSGKMIFKGAVGLNDISATADQTGGEGLGALQNKLYKQFYDSLTDYSDPEKRAKRADELAAAQVESMFNTTTYDQYGNPKTSRSKNFTLKRS